LSDPPDKTNTGTSNPGNSGGRNGKRQRKGKAKVLHNESAARKGRKKNERVERGRGIL